jgi:hypothetical protein
MKTFKKHHLPDSVQYNGKTYHINRNLSSILHDTGATPEHIKEGLKPTKTKMVIVEVLSKNLKGKLNLHNKPYKPTVWVFTTNPGE